MQSGITSQRLPLNLQAGLPADWDEFKANSITFSMAADFPLIKYWPVTFHQEICFNKFVNDYRQGSDPPEHQLIQDFSVMSLPAMVRYTFGTKEFTGFINAGVQVDIALNKNNIGWLTLGGDAISGYEAATIEYYSYSTYQPGITAGFGLSYKLSKNFALNSEFRYSSVFNVLPDKAGTESQSAFKAGVTYNIFKKEKKL
jgi:opacity protein-like surface antigen